MAKNTFEARVTVGEEDCGAEYDAVDCDLIAASFTRAAIAIRKREHGGILAINSNGARVADITVFDVKTGDESGRKILEIYGHKPRKQKAKS